LIYWKPVEFYHLFVTLKVCVRRSKAWWRARSRHEWMKWMKCVRLHQWMIIRETKLDTILKCRMKVVWRYNRLRGFSESSRVLWHNFSRNFSLFSCRRSKRFLAGLSFFSPRAILVTV
jgi:hypothetical protein